MSKSKHSAEWRTDIVKKYLSGEGSYAVLAKEYGIGETTLRDWVHRYRKHGIVGFGNNRGNKDYSRAFKIKCVEAVLSGAESVNDIVAKYNISSRSVLRRWIKCYNANMELKDYEPNSEVYMAEARRKTTLEERKEIVVYCISHNNDYKGTASKFDVS